MTAILVSDRLPAEITSQLDAAARAAGRDLALVRMPADPEARLAGDDLARIEAAFYSSDIFANRSRAFFSAVRKAQNLRWLHVFNVGVDHPVFAEMLARGVRLTTSAGTTAVPIAQTAIAGLLMLARGFPHWLDAQRRNAWEPLRGERLPQDLPGRTLCVLGLGAIGGEIARLGQALGMRVIGVRRSPLRPGDPVDEIQPPAALAQVLPRCDWLAIACPLTDDTRGLVDAAMLARLPRGAGLVNIARGEIVDEPALVDALRAGRIGAAYLDVFAAEPLPADSPLWNMPNVIVTPHNSAAAAGNDARVLALFLDNAARWLAGRDLVNEVSKAR